MESMTADKHRLSGGTGKESVANRPTGMHAGRERKSQRERERERERETAMQAQNTCMSRVYPMTSGHS